MVLKRFLITALGALGLSALAAGPISAQAQTIPVPKVLGDAATACMAPDVMDTEITTVPGSLSPLDLTTGTDCTMVNKDVTKFRTAWVEVEDAQKALNDFKDPITGTPTSVQQDQIDFLTNDLQTKQATKNMYSDDPLAAAVYAERDAIKNFTEAHEAVGDGSDTGTAAALMAAEQRYNEFNDYEFDFDGDGDATDDNAESISALEDRLTAAQGNWDDNAYGADGGLVDDDDLNETAKAAAEEIALVKRALAVAEAAAVAEASALNTAKGRDKAADDALKAAAETVTSSMEDLVKRVEGVGDSVETRLAERVRTTQRAFNSAEEERMEGAEELDELKEELRDAEEEEADAQGDYDDARAALATVLDDEDATAEETLMAQIALADADNQLVEAKEKVEGLEKDVGDSEKALNMARTGLVAEAAKARKAYEDALAAQSGTYNFEEGNPVEALVDAIVDTKGDQGGALIEALDETWDNTQENAAKIAENSTKIEGLDTGAIGENTTAIDELEVATGSLAKEMGFDAATGEGTGENGMSRIDHNESRSMANESRSMANETRSMENRTLIDTNIENIATNETNIMANMGRIDTNETNIMANMGRIDTNETNIMANMGRIDTNETNIAMNTSSIEANMASIGTNADAIAANMSSIGSNSSAISDNRNMIGELSDDLETVRAGVAASMALAGMPAINGRGISIGVGSFDGESAFAVGFQIQGEAASFKVGVTSASGATGASAGVGFQF